MITAKGGFCNYTPKLEVFWLVPILRCEKGTLKNYNYGKFIPLEVVVFLGFRPIYGISNGI